MSSVTAKTDMRGKFGPARDQGTRPACLVFAMSDTHAATRGPWCELSCEYLFFHAKKREKSAIHAGVKMHFARQALEHDGQPVETDWPYLPATPATIDEWKPPLEIGEIFRRSSNVHPGDFERAWEKVTAGSPVLIGLTISDAFYMPDEYGVVDSAEAVDPTRRHAVVAIATGDRAGARFLLVRNSWGTAWGLDGHAWLVESYMKPRMRELVTLN